MKNTPHKTHHKYEGVCEICGEEFHPADNAAQWHRNKALHMRRRHNVIGAKTVKYGKRKNRTPDPPPPPTRLVCAVIGPGVNVIFPQDYLGDILHTLAFALSGKRDWLQVKG